MLLVTLALASCAPTLTAYKLDGSGKRVHRHAASGIPYYLPKPYLLIARNLVLVPEKTEPSKSGIDSGMEPESRYTYQIVYLPEMSQQYGLRMTRGLGSYGTEISLKDGWMFTGARFEGDTEVAETIEATSKLVAEAGKLVSAGAAPQSALVKALDGIAANPVSLHLFDLTNGACVAAWPQGCGTSESAGDGIGQR